MHCVVAVKECHSPFSLTSPSLILKVGHNCIVISAMPTYLIVEDVKVRSRDATATPTKEAVQPPHYCLPTVSNSAPPLSAFYPHGYHTKVGRKYTHIHTHTHTHTHTILNECFLLFQPPDCLKELYYNKWNPPSSQRKLRGIKEGHVIP